MQSRRILLPDGRYMIFYTFDGEETIEDTTASAVASSESEPEKQDV